MDTKIYWVGEKPGGSVAVEVLDAGGNPADLSSFNDVALRMLDSANQEVYVSQDRTSFRNKANGTVAFSWPQDRSLFTRAGEYVLQLVLSTPTSTRYTSVQTILVKEFGGTK